MNILSSEAILAKLTKILCRLFNIRLRNHRRNYRSAVNTHTLKVRHSFLINSAYYYDRNIHSGSYFYKLFLCDSSCVCLCVGGIHCTNAKVICTVYLCFFSFFKSCRRNTYYLVLTEDFSCNCTWHIALYQMNACTVNSLCDIQSVVDDKRHIVFVRYLFYSNCKLIELS